MSVRGVLGNEVEDQLETVAVRPREQSVKIRHAAEDGSDSGVIADVVAEVRHRGGKDRRDPQRVDTELGQIRKPADDVWQITHAIAIAILNGARIDLIDDGCLPSGLDHVSGRHCREAGVIATPPPPPSRPRCA
jgi:hypothetical protein